MVNNYVTFDDVLKNPCKKVSVEEGKKIAVELINKLVKDKNAIGLAANQVGIDASVAVVNVRKPIILINPEVIETWDEIPYYEGCLSYKGKGIQTSTSSQLKSNFFKANFFSGNFSVIFI